MIALFKTEPLIYILLLVYLGAVVIFWFYPGGRSSRRTHRLCKPLLIGVVALLTQILFTAKHPFAHYLIPAMVTSCMLNALVIAQCRYCFGFRSDFPMAILALLFMIGTVHCLKRSSAWVRVHRTHVNQIVEIESFVRARPDCSPVYYFRSFSFEQALYFGNVFSKSVHSSVLAKIYPKFLFYNNFDRKFYSFSGFVAPAIIASRLKDECFLFVGPPIDEDSWLQDRGIKLRPKIQSGAHAVYQLMDLRL